MRTISTKCSYNFNVYLVIVVNCANNQGSKISNAVFIFAIKCKKKNILEAVYYYLFTITMVYDKMLKWRKVQSLKYRRQPNVT